LTGEHVFPDHFETYDNFHEWLLASFSDGATTVGKGQTFRDFAIDVLPMTSRARRFGSLSPNPKHSYDGGVDATSEQLAGEQLVVQSKLTIVGKDDIDAIISKFEGYEAGQELGDDGRLFTDGPRVVPTYAIVTGAKATGIISRYERSATSSRRFYDRLQAEKRLLVWDGEALLREVRQILTRRFRIPPRIELTSQHGWIHSGGVYVGIVRGRDFAELEDQHGPGLFFENVRGYKGLESVSDRDTVNEAILQTARENPERMLARNNGIALRAASIRAHGDKLILDEASIVNGRQTTGCLVELRDSLETDCEVQVKVVEAGSDAWDIAEASNNQNAVSQIDLKLARYFRVQLAQREAAERTQFLKAGSKRRFSALVAGVREDEDTFDHLRYLFIGLFCRRPNQLWDDNYSKLMWDVLEAYFEDGQPPSNLYPTLFRIVESTDAALVRCEGLGDDDPIARIHEESRPKYRAYLGLLTLCATLDIDLAEQFSATSDEVERVRRLVDETEELLAERAIEYSDNFMIAYLMAAELVLEAYEEGDETKVQRRMATTLSGRSFTELFRRLRIRLGLESRKKQMTQMATPDLSDD
jgi:hypothetical protein